MPNTTIPIHTFERLADALGCRGVPYVQHPAGPSYGWGPVDPDPIHTVGTYLTNRAIDAVPDAIDASEQPDLWQSVVDAFLGSTRWVSEALCDVAIVAVRDTDNRALGVWVAHGPPGSGRFVLGSDPIDVSATLDRLLEG